MDTQKLYENLMELARKAQENSYSPYSKFPVGVALITVAGDVVVGCNVENISYGLSTCGERTAVCKMISEKGPQSRIRALAVATPIATCSPCGACRQVIQEFSTPETKIIYQVEGKLHVSSLTDLLPGAFDAFPGYSLCA